MSKNYWLDMEKQDEEHKIAVSDFDNGDIDAIMEHLKEIGYQFVLDENGEVKAVMISCELYREMVKIMHPEDYEQRLAEMDAVCAGETNEM